MNMQTAGWESVAANPAVHPAIVNLFVGQPMVLASASPRRADLLRQIGVTFTVVSSDVPEIHHDQLTAAEAAQINAYRKARAVAKKHPDALVLGADTLVYLGTKLFGKPDDLEDAYRMLEELQGKTHQVVTGICLMHLRQRRHVVRAESTAVQFRPLDAVAIRRYLTHVNPLDKAGAYAIQEHGDWLVESVQGSYSNVIGLPTERLAMELGAWGGTRGV
jgi:septum formation protein